MSSVAHCATRLRIMVKDKEKSIRIESRILRKFKVRSCNGAHSNHFGTGTLNRIYDEVRHLLD